MLDPPRRSWVIPPSHLSPRVRFLAFIYYELLKLFRVQDPKRQRVGVRRDRILTHESDIDFYGSGWMKIEVVGAMKKSPNRKVKRGKGREPGAMHAIPEPAAVVDETEKGDPGPQDQ